MDNYYVKIFAVDMGIQFGAWVVSAALKTEKFYDLTGTFLIFILDFCTELIYFAGSATFIILSYLSQRWSDGTMRQVVQSNMVIAWALRLGSFLFIRVMKDGKDRRFDNVRDNPGRFLTFWMIQGLLCLLQNESLLDLRHFILAGVWVFVTLLPTLMLNNESTDKRIGKQDYLGWALWAVGMFFEIVADYQKSAFRKDPQNEVNIFVIEWGCGHN